LEVKLNDAEAVMLRTLQLYIQLVPDVQEKLELRHLPLGHLGVGTLKREWINSKTNFYRVLVVGLNPSVNDVRHISDEVHNLG
jgi:hypothetical protein